MNKTLSALTLTALALSPTLAHAQRGYLTIPVRIRSGGTTLPAKVADNPEAWGQWKQQAQEQMDLALQEKAECKAKYHSLGSIRDCEGMAQRHANDWLERIQAAEQEYQRQLRLAEPAKK